MDTRCRDCKFWGPLGSKKNGQWEQYKDVNDDKLGWCRISHPIMAKENGEAYWPKTAECHSCGEFESSKSEEDRWREYYYNLRSDYDKYCRGLRDARRKLKTIIKEVKAKYPKIRINDIAIKKAVEIIQKHENTKD